ncbi:ABC transporter permease [Oceanobacillus sojae]|uniref:Multidrug ABC transporter permease n=1 Tax=Oceanobacillus sojae TaxID=582851 RepID=A0A511ZFJ2_9BACI|nr:ABC transporter permease [Oceanobacillus sojae]GEN86215.1 multidrug ABC transporter permease [Oceanobacillus sojae]
MILSLVKADFLKIKRKGMWLLCLIGPFGVVALQMVNYGVRKDYLFDQMDDRWLYYILNINSFTPLAIVLGIVILTSFMASIEDETNAWKQLVALPVSKREVYLSKFTVVSCVLFLSSVLLFLFMSGYGLTLGLGADIPYLRLMEYSFLPFFAAFPVLGLQLWVATVSKNQAIPVTLGVVGVILAYSAPLLPDWVIWKWPALSNDWDHSYINALLGIGFGLVLYLLGMIDFKRRDVK